MTLGQSPSPRRRENNCTGTTAFDGPLFGIFPSPDGRVIWMIQTNPGSVFQGTAKRVSRQQESN
jgi:hypothetical protein